MPLRPLRRRSANSAFSGSLPMLAAFTSRCRPVAVSVITMAARRAARSAFNAARRSSCMNDFQPLVHLYHEHPDGPSAGQTDLPGGLVGDAKFQHFRLPRVDHIKRLGDHGAFDAAAGNRAQEITLLVDHEV